MRIWLYIIGLILLVDGVYGLANLDWVMKRIKLGAPRTFWRIILTIELSLSAAIFYYLLSTR